MSGPHQGHVDCLGSALCVLFSYRLAQSCPHGEAEIQARESGSTPALLSPSLRTCPPSLLLHSVVHSKSQASLDSRKGEIGSTS